MTPEQRCLPVIPTFTLVKKPFILQSPAESVTCSEASFLYPGPCPALVPRPFLPFGLPHSTLRVSLDGEPLKAKEQHSKES